MVLKQALGRETVILEAEVVRATVTARRDFGYTPWSRHILGYFIEHSTRRSMAASTTRVPRGPMSVAFVRMSSRL